MPQRQRLSAQAWVDAALAALADGGVGAVAVEPIAARLGTTKGSFYWHFATRDALLEATLQHWERTDTEEVIALLEGRPVGPAGVGPRPDARTRLRTLLLIALGGRPGEPAGQVELALLATPEHPLVVPVLSRVTRRRLGYLDQLFAELGFPAEQARQRALLGYSAYLGHAQLARATTDLAPTGDALIAHVDATLDALTHHPGR